MTQKKTPKNYIVSTFHFIGFIGFVVGMYFTIFSNINFPYNIVMIACGLGLLITATPEYQKMILRKPQERIAKVLVWIISCLIYLLALIPLWGIIQDTAGARCTGFFGATVDCLSNATFLLFLLVFSNPLVLWGVALVLICGFLYSWGNAPR